MKKTMTILLAVFIMLGFASCLDRNRAERDLRDNGYDANYDYNYHTSVPGEISMVNYF